jgi:hypothetical protein
MGQKTIPLVKYRQNTVRFLVTYTNQALCGISSTTVQKALVVAQKSLSEVKSLSKIVSLRKMSKHLSKNLTKLLQ